MTEFMRNSDAFTWAMESDPRLRSTVVTVILLDRSPDWDEVRRRFELISRKVPMVRQRVVPSPPPAPPRWEHAPDFDLDFHMRRVTAPAPGTVDTVLEMARLAAMEDFDRARPLWEATLIDGLEDDRAAMVLKFHHALTDGVGGIQIGMILFDLSEVPERHGPAAELPEVPPPPWLRGYRDTARYDVRLVSDALIGTVKMAPKLLSRSVLRPVDTVSSAAELAASVYRTVRPVTRTGSPLMNKRSLIRRLGVLDVPFGAASGGRPPQRRCAERRIRRRCGRRVAPLPRKARRLGRRPAPDDADEPARRGRRDGRQPDHPDAVRRAGRHRRSGGADPPASTTARTKVRHEKSLPYTQWIAGALNMMPRWYIGSILRNVDFLCSDVPGIPVPVFLGGAKVLTQYGFGPTIGSAVNVTLLTYVDVCSLGIDVDTGAIPDYDLFYDSLVAGFDEVLALGAADP